MKHSIKIASDCGYVGLVLCALVLPLITMSFSMKEDKSNAENRVLSSFPSVKDENGNWNEDYFSQSEAWFSEHFGLRPEMVTAYGKLTHKLFATSSNQDVIIGKDDWLFYADTINDSLGISSITTNGAKHIAKTVSMLSEYAAEHDAELVFTVAPNKSSIYGEYLPSRFVTTGEPNALDLLTEALSETDVSYCDLRKALQSSAAKQPDFPIYHKLDTHWNGEGAMIGFSSLMHTLSLDDHGFPSAKREITQDWEGDLWKMLYPSEEHPDTNVVYDIPKTYETIGRFRSVDDLNIRTECSSAEGSLLMVRDSFGRALIPLFSEAFASCTYIRADRIPLHMLESQPCDHVILEIVERNLPRYLQYAPIISAREVTEMWQNPTLFTVADKATGQIVVPTIQAEQSDGYLHLYGTFHTVLSDCDAVFCKIGNRVYEAFPCYETELLGESKTGDNGFSLFLSDCDIQEQESVQIIAKRGADYFNLGSNKIENMNISEES